MRDESSSRRALIKMLSLGAVAALGGAGSVAGAADASAPLVPLTTKDATASSLHYSEDSSKVDAAANPSHKPEQKCATCAQYKGKAGDARGGCNIYPGKSVSANGWCMVWAKKP